MSDSIMFLRDNCHCKECDVWFPKDEINENIYLAARNLHKIELTDVEAIHPVNLIHYEKILITAPALKQIEELLA